MPDVLTDWRTALINALRATFPEAEVMSGPRTGVSRDKARICVFAPPGPMGHLQNRVNVATPRMVVRYWPARSRQPANDPDWNGEDTTELEAAKTALESFLKPRQASLGVPNLWFFLVTSINIDSDPDEWGVEAILDGQGENLAAGSA